MTEKTIADAVAEAMNPEEFDVLDYLETGDVAEDKVTIYTHLPSSRRLEELMLERTAVIEQRRAEAHRAAEKGESPILGLGETPVEDEDTVYDDEINALVEKLEETKLVFHMKSVAPGLVRAINKSYDAKKPKDLDAQADSEYEDKRTADILSRAIDRVERGDGSIDPKPWDAARLSKAEERLYKEQSGRLLNALYDMVYAGAYFEKALTADFS